jgi:DNA-binding MarR family transcriptional regulator
MAKPLNIRDCLCLHTRRGSRRVTQFYDAMMHDSGLRVTQFLLLAAVGQMQPVSQQPLADWLGMERTTLTRNLAVLEREGLATIEKGKDDRRKNQIRLTRKGRTAIQRATPFWEKAQTMATLHLDGYLNGDSTVARKLLDRLAALAPVDQPTP